MKCRSCALAWKCERVPHGEGLDRLVGRRSGRARPDRLWVGKRTPGTEGLTVPGGVLITASVAVRRRWPLAVGSFGAAATALLCSWTGPQTTRAPAVGWLLRLVRARRVDRLARFLVGCGVVAANALSRSSVPDGKRRSAVHPRPARGDADRRGAVRDRQLRAEALAARAELLEREQELRADEAVAEERARIARELHDLVAHNVSVMVVQAGAERHALGEDQESTRATLASIEQAGRQALAEARRLLGMLRRKGDHEELEPQPSVDQIDLLIEQVERAGLPVKLDVEGERVPLPAGVDLCAYRIVQEGLTNALKHAGPARAEVACATRRGRWTSRSATTGAGRRRERRRGGPRPDRDARARGAVRRCAAAGPREGGGFEIRAHLPLA